MTQESVGFAQYQARILPIAQQGEPILQVRALPVEDARDPTVQRLIDDLQATMLAANGVGIAAPQVFVSQRIVIIASRPNPRYPDAPLMDAVAMINPEIIWQSDKVCSGEEGCLSVPGERVPVERAEQVRVRYLTRAGDVQVAEYAGFVARIVQHECDHLDGILFTDYLQR